jgi:phosphate/sulfate permease
VTQGSSFTVKAGLSFLIPAGIAVGFAMGFVIQLYLLPFFKNKMEDQFDLISPVGRGIEDNQNRVRDLSKWERRKQLFFSFVLKDKELSQLGSDQVVEKLHGRCESFPTKFETIFTILQVFAAISASFIHGGKDGLNAVIGLASVYHMYVNQHVSPNVPIYNWQLLLVGVAFALGICFFNFKVTTQMGMRITKISPSKSFVILVGAQIVITINVFLGIPVSSSLCIAAGIIGVGLVGSSKCGHRQIQWKVVLKLIMAWVLTPLLSGGWAAMFTLAACKSNATLRAQCQ